VLLNSLSSDSDEDDDNAKTLGPVALSVCNSPRISLDGSCDLTSFPVLDKP
jgi:hypothetical protein